MPLTKEEAFGSFVDTDGTTTVLGRESCNAVRATLRVLQGGKVPESHLDPWLTTGQAAKELGVSRRTVTRIVDGGGIPCERYGNGHRRLRLSEVLRYKERERAHRHEALEDMRHIASAGGLDDLDMIEGYLGQFADEG